MSRPKGSKNQNPGKPRKKRNNVASLADARDARDEAEHEHAAGIGHNGGPDAHLSRLTPSEERELFASHRKQWATYQNKLKIAEEFGIEVKAALKADGFKILHMRIADDLGTPKGEQKVVADVKDRLMVARWIGHEMGKQADLFEQPDRTPLVDRAYDHGKQASIENKPRQPPHAPETEAYAAWMQGYSDHQEELSNRVGRGSSLSDQIAPMIEEGDKIARGELPSI